MRTVTISKILCEATKLQVPKNKSGENEITRYSSALASCLKRTRHFKYNIYEYLKQNLLLS